MEFIGFVVAKYENKFSFHSYSIKIYVIKIKFEMKKRKKKELQVFITGKLDLGEEICCFMLSLITSPTSWPLFLCSLPPYRILPLVRSPSTLFLSALNFMPLLFDGRKLDWESKAVATVQMFLYIYGCQTKFQWIRLIKRWHFQMASKFFLSAFLSTFFSTYPLFASLKHTHTYTDLCIMII